MIYTWYMISMIIYMIYDIYMKYTCFTHDIYIYIWNIRGLFYLHEICMIYAWYMTYTWNIHDLHMMYMKYTCYIVFTWYMHDMWYRHEIYMIYTWYIWYTRGILNIHVIYIIYDIYMKFTWYTHDIYIWYVHGTSSAAQGGGGSFKTRKPIGEDGCCESRMAERIHWWTERWFELCFLEWLQWLQWSPGPWPHPQLLDVVWCSAAVVVVVV